tara:strand:- start:68 stop:223 length:156 start_codon:yes stop_codon:yes gene_type:complete
MTINIARKVILAWDSSAIMKAGMIMAGIKTNRLILKILGMVLRSLKEILSE